MLIQEITRQCHLKGVFQAAYTAGVVLPGVVGTSRYIFYHALVQYLTSTSRYYHRPLNAKKLVEIGFAQTPSSMSLPQYMKHCQVPSQVSLPGFREIARRDIPHVRKLLRSYLARFAYAPVFTEAEIEHLFFKSRGVETTAGQRRTGQVVWSYVVEDPATKEITDFISMYSLPATVVKKSAHSAINAAYLYYYATNVALPKDYRTNPLVFDPTRSESVEMKMSIAKRLKALTSDLLVMAAKVRLCQGSSSHTHSVSLITMLSMVSRLWIILRFYQI